MSKKPNLPGVDAIFGSVPSAPPRAEKRTEPARKGRETAACVPARKPAEVQSPDPPPEPSSDLSMDDSSNAATAEFPAVNPRADSGDPGADDEAADSVAGESPHKVTLYILPSVEEKLEETWYRLRRRRRDKLPKWRIVNAILQRHLPDLDQVESLLGK